MEQSSTTITLGSISSWNYECWLVVSDTPFPSWRKFVLCCIYSVTGWLWGRSELMKFSNVIIGILRLNVDKHAFDERLSAKTDGRRGRNMIKSFVKPRLSSLVFSCG